MYCSDRCRVHNQAASVVGAHVIEDIGEGELGQFCNDICRLNLGLGLDLSIAVHGGCGGGDAGLCGLGCKYARNYCG